LNINLKLLIRKKINSGGKMKNGIQTPIMPTNESTTLEVEPEQTKFRMHLLEWIKC
jgi:hypothetical protein